MDQDQPTQSFESYKKIKVIGKGSFGKAFLVQAESDGSYAVIKKIDIAKLSEQEKKDTIKEAKILEVLNHPNIIHFREVYKTKKGQLCIVMDFADGGDLQGKLKEQKEKGGFLSEDTILNWFTQICLAMKHVHDRKILHRDLKSGNVFLMKNGIVKLGDFGIAKVLNATVDQAQTIVGTPYYLSPEIIQNHPYNFKSDMWSLGVLLYEMCALKPPFNGANIHMLAMQIVNGKFQPLPSNFSHQIKTLISSLMTQDPKQRPNINQVLKNNLLSSRIRNFLENKDFQEEFSHTLLHKQNLFERTQTKMLQQMAASASKEDINAKSTLGINSAVNGVLGMINQIEGRDQKQNPPQLSKPWEIKPPSYGAGNKFEISGEDIQLQGQKLPQVFKQQQKNISKIKADREQVKAVYQTAQQRRQEELEEKKNKIQIEINKKAEMQNKKKNFMMQQQIIKQQKQLDQKEQKLNDREAQRAQMREDLKKRKAEAMKSKQKEVEIMGVQQAEIDKLAEKSKEPHVEKMPKEEYNDPRDPFKVEAQKYARKGWGQQRPEEAPEKKEVIEVDGVVISQKDKERLDRRRIAEEKKEAELQRNYEEYQSAKQEDLKSYYDEFNQYQQMIGNVLGIKESDLQKKNSELPKSQDPIEISSADQDTRGASFNDSLEFSNLIPDKEEEDEEEINFDQLLGDAAQSQAEYEQDREDSEDDGDDLPDLTDSFALSKTTPLLAQDGVGQNIEASSSSAQPQGMASMGSSQENAMWDMVINKHGKQEFQACYDVIAKYQDDRFSETSQKKIQTEAASELSKLGMSETGKQQELIGLVSSFMILEEFQKNQQH